MSNIEALIKEEIGRTEKKLSALRAALDALSEKAPKPARSAKPRPGRKVRRDKHAESGYIGMSEARKITGLHQTTLAKMKREGVLRGPRGKYDRESISLYMESRAK